MNSVGLNSILLICSLYATLVHVECDNRQTGNAITCQNGTQFSNKGDGTQATTSAEINNCQPESKAVVPRDSQALCNALKTTGSHKSELDATCASYVFCYSTTVGNWFGVDLECGDDFWYNDELGYCTEIKPNNCI